MNEPLPARPKLLASMRVKLAAAFGSALLVPVVVILGLLGLERADEARGWVQHGVAIRSDSRDLTEALLGAQVARVDYLAFGDTELLDDGIARPNDARRALDRLRTSTLSDPSQQERVSQVEGLLEDVLVELERSLELAKEGRRDEVLEQVRARKDRQALAKVERLLAEIHDHEDALLADRRAVAAERAATVRLLLIIGGALAFLLATFVIIRIRVNLHALEDAHDTIADQAAELAERATQLERSVKELDQFAYVASHDLKAPLRAIASLATWIEEDAGDRLEGESREHLRLLVSRVQRMDALVSGILDYSRAGRSGVDAEPIDVAALVEEVVELISPPERVIITVETPLPSVVGPRVPLQQIWMNLVSNALKHGTPDGGRIGLGYRDTDQGPAYYVSDDGPGIDPRFHAKVFTLFQTLAPRDEVEGTGIGLTVVKKLVEQQGGRVWLESAEGEGTTFYFTFPGSPSARAAAADAKRRSGRGGSTLRAIARAVKPGG